MDPITKTLLSPEFKQIHFDEAKLSDIPVATEFMDGLLESMDCPMKAQISLDIAIDEIYNNLASYAYEGKLGPVTVYFEEIHEPKHGIKVYFVDNGVFYDPLAKADPDTTLSAEDRKIGGLGIFMVKKSMDNMEHDYIQECNVITLTKYFE